MKNYPEIMEAVFGDIKNGVVNEKFTAADAAINSALLRKACELAGTKFDGAEFTAPSWWEMRIQDQHDDHEAEPEPHYVLHVGYGTGELRNQSWHELTVAYCDNHSVVRQSEELSWPLGVYDETTIEQAPGRFTISVRGAFGHHHLKTVARQLARTYVDTMKEFLPDYFIVVDEDAINGMMIE